MSERFSAATAFEAEGVRAGLVSCLTCGAAILLDHRDRVDVLALHAGWHDSADSDGSQPADALVAEESGSQTSSAKSPTGKDAE